MIIGHFYTPPADKGGLKIVSGVPRHYAHIPHHSALDFSPWRVTALIGWYQIEALLALPQYNIGGMLGSPLRNGKQITLPSDSFFSSSLHDLNRRVERLCSS